MGRANTVDKDAVLTIKATARDRWAVGTHRPIMVMAAGKTAASPAPSAILAPTSASSDVMAAGGVRAVKRDHQRTAIPSTTLPPKRFAKAPVTSIRNM